MKPLIARTIRNRSHPSGNTHTFGTHQMIPLSENDGVKVASLRARTNDSTYSANVASEYEAGTSDEYVISKQGREQYDLPQPLPKSYQ